MSDISTLQDHIADLMTERADLLRRVLVLEKTLDEMARRLKTTVELMERASRGVQS